MAIPGSELSEALANVVETAGKSVVRVDGGRRRALSGIAWSAHEVLTANHGVHQDEVLIGTGEAELKGKVKGRDPSRDLALIEVDGALTPAQFGDGQALKVGHLVLQLARPGETVRATSGIVSVLGHRPWRSGRGGEIDRWLETDAPHQPGFSGGALTGLDGKVLGLVSTGLIRGTSVAVPYATLKNVAEQLQKHGRVRQGYLGVSMQPVQLPGDVKAATGEEIGLLVIGVEKGGPADQAGVLYGDTLLHLGDDSVKTLEDLYSYLRSDHVGEKVPVKLWRNGKLETLQLTLGAKP
ncbi:MAG: PDZ domain-containing protein [Myxococcaceae bacterium]